MPKAISLEEAKERLFNRHNGNIVLLEYKNMKAKNKFECRVCGNVWDADGDNVIGKLGEGCPECYRKNMGNWCRLSDDHVNDFITSINAIWVSGEYKNNSSKLEIEFDCGHTVFITYNSLTSGKRCSICGTKKGHENKRNSLEKIKNKVESYGFDFIDVPFGYENGQSIIRYRCSLGHITERKYIHFHLHPHCGVCAKEEVFRNMRHDHDEICDIVESRNCTLISDEGYESNKSYVTVLFPCGHEESLKLSTFCARPCCLCKDCAPDMHKGRNSKAWQNGITKTSMYLRGEISDWYKRSLEYTNYKCVITGLPAQTVHHVFAFSKIVAETFDILGYEIKEQVGDYDPEDLKVIRDYFLQLQDYYGLGYPLTKKAHDLFHNLYSTTNFTPEDFYEFQQRIQSGEIQI